jgi:hypothetical protein
MPVYNPLFFLKKREGFMHCTVSEDCKSRSESNKATKRGATGADAAAVQARKEQSKSDLHWELLCFVYHTMTP